jgi:RHS repeat-associated protein
MRGSPLADGAMIALRQETATLGERRTHNMNWEQFVRLPTDRLAAVDPVDDHVEYTPFGHIVPDTNSANGVPVMFTELYEYRTSGIVFAKGRSELVTTGQWMQEDPAGFVASDANLRRYVENDPTNLTDPGGRQPDRDQERFLGGEVTAVNTTFPLPESTFMFQGRRATVTAQLVTFQQSARDGMAAPPPAIGYLRFQFTVPGLNDLATMREVHLLQLFRTRRYDKREGGNMQTGTYSWNDIPGIGRVYKPSDNKWYLDTVHPTSPYVDSPGISRARYERTADSLTFLDRPSANTAADSRRVEKEFHTYLVYKGTILYEVDWQYAFRWNGVGKAQTLTPDYLGGRGPVRPDPRAPSPLPKELAPGQFIGGYDGTDFTGTAAERYYPNPIKDRP